MPNPDKSSKLDKFRSDPSSFIEEHNIFYHTFFSDSDFNTGDMYEFICKDIGRHIGEELSQHILVYKDSSLSISINMLHVSGVILDQRVIVGLDGDEIIFMIPLVDNWMAYTDAINSLEVSQSSDNICFSIQLMDNLKVSFQLVGDRYKLSNLRIDQE